MALPISPLVKTHTVVRPGCGPGHLRSAPSRRRKGDRLERRGPQQRSREPEQRAEAPDHRHRGHAPGDGGEHRGPRMLGQEGPLSVEGEGQSRGGGPRSQSSGLEPRT